MKLSFLKPAILALACAITPPQLNAALLDADWLGGVGDWFDIGQWSGGVAPANTATDTYNVRIDLDLLTISTVTYAGLGNTSIERLQIDAGDSLLLTSGSLTVGLTPPAVGTAEIVNAGLLDISAATGVTSLFILGDVTLSGGGTLTLSGNPGETNARIVGEYVLSNPLSLTGHLINEDNLIEGSGIIGADNFEDAATLRFTNNGTVRAGDGHQLYIVAGPASGGGTPEADRALTNNGSLLAEDGGRLLFTANEELNIDESGEGDWTIDNSLGQITARGFGGDASIVEFSGDIGQHRIIGGLISAEQGGQVFFSGQTSLADLTVSATEGSVIYGYRSDDISSGSLNNARFARVAFETDETSFIELGTSFDSPQDVLLEEVSLAGNVSLASGTFGVLGSLENSGSLYLGASADPGNLPGEPFGTSVSLVINGEVALTGGGTLFLGGLPGEFNLSIVGDQDFTFTSDPSHLINEDNTIEGSGIIGANTIEDPATLRLTNNATVRAGENQELFIVAGPSRGGFDPEADRALTNNGFLLAEDGGRLLFPAIDELELDESGEGDWTIDNSFGEITARGVGGDVSIVEFYGDFGQHRIIGGLISAEDGGQVFFANQTNLADLTVSATDGSIIYGYRADDIGNGSLINARFARVAFETDEASFIELATPGVDPQELLFEEVSLAGNVSLATGSFGLLGTLENTGNLYLGASADPNGIPGETFGSTVSLVINGEVSLTGGGTLFLGSNPGDLNVSIVGDDEFTFTPDPTHLINEDNLIEGSGTIGAEVIESLATLRFTNNGTVRAGDGHELFVVAGVYAGGDPEFDRALTNNGFLLAEDGGRLIFPANEEFFALDEFGEGDWTIDNSFGQITARGSGGEASLVEFLAEDGQHRIIGGLISAELGGQVFLGGRTSLADLTVSATDGSVIYGYRSDDIGSGSLHDARFARVAFETDETSFIELGTNGGEPQDLLLEEVSFAGNVSLATGYFGVLGDLENSGNLYLGATADPGFPGDPLGTQVSLTINGEVTLTGGGTLFLGGFPGEFNVRIVGDQDLFYSPDPSHLINEDNLIEGSGIIGAEIIDNQAILRFTNNATVRASDGHELYLVVGPSYGGFDPEIDRALTNNGFLLAEDGGRLIFPAIEELELDEFGEGNWTIDNSFGEITARGESSIVEFYGDFGQHRIIGGLISAEQGGQVFFANQTHLADLTVSATEGSAVYGYRADDIGNGSLFNARFARVTFETDETSFIELATPGEEPQELLFEEVSLAGNVSLAYGTFGLLGTLENTGTLYLGASADPNGIPGETFGNPVSLVINGEVSLTGGGTLFLGGNPGEFNLSIIDDDLFTFSGDPAHLINEDNLIEGSGIIGANSTDNSTMLRFTNNATVRAGDGHELYLVAGPSYGDPDFGLSLTNNGFLLAEDGGRLLFPANDELDLDESGEGGWTIDNTFGEITARGVGGDVSIVEFFAENGQHRIIGGLISAEQGGQVFFAGRTNLADLTVSATDGSIIYGYRAEDIGLGSLNNARFARVAFETDETSFIELGTPFDSPQDMLLEEVSFAGNVSLATGSFGLLGTLENSGTLYLGASADPGNPGEPSGSLSLVINGEVALTGGGTLILGDNPGDLSVRIVGDQEFNFSGDPAHLINEDNLIEGSGLIGADDLLLLTPATLRFTNRGTVRAREGDLLYIKSDVANPFTNDGRLEVQRGGSLTITGPTSLTLSSTVATEIGGTLVDDEYSVLTFDGPAVLDGTYAVSLVDAFTPVVGQTFTPVTWASRSGEFRSYAGFRFGGNLVFQPTYDATGLTLTVAMLSSGASQPLVPVADGGSQPVLAAAPYDGLTSVSTDPGALGTVATIIGGSASGSTTVTFDLAPVAGEFSAANGGLIASDVLSLSGTGSDKFVLQLEYNEALALAAFGTEEHMFLAWFSPLLSEFVNAVEGNSDGGLNALKFFGAYDPNTQFVLGYYGVDTVADRVWAVIDHNSDFGAGGAAIPEPTTTGLLLLGLGCLGSWRRRNGQKAVN